MPKVYRELRIIPNQPTTPRAYLDVMERHAVGGWIRGNFLHVNHPGRRVDSLWSETEAFHRERDSALEMVVLSIDDRVLSLVDVLCSSRDLTVDDFNMIAETFCIEVVHPATAEVGATVDLTTDHEALDGHLDPIALSRLKGFCNAANKSSRALQPPDRERWIEFLTAAYRTDGDLDVQLLKCWLIEEGGWSSEIASALAAEFAFGKRLFARYAEEVSK